MEKIRGEKIAMVYQEPMTALNPAFTIGDQLGEVFRFHQGLKKREALDRARISSAGGHSLSHKPDQGLPPPAERGMRQRAVIAMAMACNPEILIADEPVTRWM